jgi:hypothetical protein
LHDEAVRRTGASRPLVVGDRLDTDIDGALAVGADSLLVLTGVTTLLQAVRLPAGRRPSYVGADLRSLLEAHPPVEIAGSAATCGTATAAIVDGVVSARGTVIDTCAIRAACALGWNAVDAGVTVVALDDSFASATGAAAP